MLNFCTHAQQYFDKSPLRLKEGYSTIMPGLSAYMAESQKFILPDNGILFEEKDTILDFEHISFDLPFPVTCLEYNAPSLPHEKPGVDGVLAPKRIVLAITIEGLNANSLFKDFIFQQLAIMNSTGQFLQYKDDFIVLWPLLGFDDGKWMPSWCGMLLPPGSQGLIPVTPEQYRQEYGSKNVPEKEFMTKDFVPVIPLPFIRGFAELGLSKQQMFDNFRQDLGPELVALKQFCEVLSCENITTTVCHPNRKLAKKHLKKKRMQLYSYHVLNLTGVHYEKHEHLHHSDRNSPRFHFRRGHTRVISKTKKVWVRSCTVGTGPGIVDKDYSMVTQ